MSNTAVFAQIFQEISNDPYVSRFVDPARATALYYSYDLGPVHWLVLSTYTDYTAGDVYTAVSAPLLSHISSPCGWCSRLPQTTRSVVALSLSHAFPLLPPQRAKQGS